MKASFRTAIRTLMADSESKSEKKNPHSCEEEIGIEEKARELGMTREKFLQIMDVYDDDLKVELKNLHELQKLRKAPTPEGMVTRHDNSSWDVGAFYADE